MEVGNHSVEGLIGKVMHEVQDIIIKPKLRSFTSRLTAKLTSRASLVLLQQHFKTTDEIVARLHQEGEPTDPKPAAVPFDMRATPKQKFRLPVNSQIDKEDDALKKRKSLANGFGLALLKRYGSVKAIVT